MRKLGAYPPTIDPETGRFLGNPATTQDQPLPIRLLILHQDDFWNTFYTDVTLFDVETFCNLALEKDPDGQPTIVHPHFMTPKMVQHEKDMQEQRGLASMHASIANLIFIQTR